jgi:hypothetical protein
VGKVRVIDLDTVHALSRASVDVQLSTSLRRAEFITALRRQALFKLEPIALSYAADLTAEDIVFTALPGKPDAWGCRQWRCRWEPTGAEAEFLGGPRDGQLMSPASPRTEILFSLLAPDWQEVMAGPNPPAVIPKVEYRYHIAGYNLATRRWVFQLKEGE